MSRRARGSGWECGTCPLTTEITVIFHRAVRAVAARTRGLRSVRRAVRRRANCERRARSRRGGARCTDSRWTCTNLQRRRPWRGRCSEPGTDAELRTRRSPATRRQPSPAPPAQAHPSRVSKVAPRPRPIIINGYPDPTDRNMCSSVQSRHRKKITSQNRD